MDRPISTYFFRPRHFLDTTSARTLRWLRGHVDRLHHRSKQECAMASQQKADPQARRLSEVLTGQRAVCDAQSERIVTHQIGAMPIINHILQRMRLDALLAPALKSKGKPHKISTVRVVSLLIRNILVSREPMYGVAEWARNYGPECFEIWPEDFDYLNDDRIGRCLEQVHDAVSSSVVMEIVTHIVNEFHLSLDELHNDSTSVSLHGNYASATDEQQLHGQKTPAITWGHSKDHRPDLKQLLYILTVTEDGGVPIYFQTESGNVADAVTHQSTWKIMAQLTGRTDFVYVADCKLASADNMNFIAQQGGRFITVLPASRKEDSTFRTRIAETPDQVSWKIIDQQPDNTDSFVEQIQVCTEPLVSKEGYRILWFHSLSKAITDQATRARNIERAVCKLQALRTRLTGPRPRLRQR